MGMEFLIYGTRSSKDKSGAYLFLPDGEAKVTRDTLQTPAGPGGLRSGGQEEGHGPSSRATLPASVPRLHCPCGGWETEEHCLGAWARLGQGSQPRACWEQVLLPDRGPACPCFALCAVGSAATCSFPSPMSPRTLPCCASRKALSSQRWWPTMSTFTR